MRYMIGPVEEDSFEKKFRIFCHSISTMANCQRSLHQSLAMSLTRRCRFGGRCVDKGETSFSADVNAF